MLSRHPQPLPAPTTPGFSSSPLEQGEAIVFMRLMLGMTACVHDSLKSQSCFVNCSLKIKLRKGTSDDEVASVFSAAVNWILFQEAASPLSAASWLEWLPFCIACLSCIPERDQVDLKVSEVPHRHCYGFMRGTKRDIAGSQNLELQLIYMK